MLLQPKTLQPSACTSLVSEFRCYCFISVGGVAALSQRVGEAQHARRRVRACFFLYACVRVFWNGLEQWSVINSLLNRHIIGVWTTDAIAHSRSSWGIAGSARWRPSPGEPLHADLRNLPFLWGVSPQVAFLYLFFFSKKSVEDRLAMNP